MGNTFKIIYFGCLLLNIIGILAILIALICYILFHNVSSFNQYYNQEQYIPLKKITSLAILVLFIWNIVIWAKKDKSVGRIIALLFMNWIYSPFYSYRVIKNKWI